MKGLWILHCGNPHIDWTSPCSVGKNMIKHVPLNGTSFLLGRARVRRPRRLERTAETSLKLPDLQGQGISRGS